jgi:hypothetical protein
MADGILIDAKGQRWADRSWDLLRRLGRYGAHLDPASFAVRECGFIHVQPKQTGARVALRAGGFGLETLAGTLYTLKDRHFPRILVAMLIEGVWHHEMVGSAGAFAVCAERLLAGEIGYRCSPWIAVERQLGALALPEFAQVRPLVDLWHDCRGRMPEDLQQIPAAQGLLERMLLMRQRPKTSRLVFAHFGGAIECVQPGQNLLLVDRDVHDQPDGNYGVWVASAYGKVFPAARPGLHSIRASVRLSETTLAQGRYDRLTLPWRRRGNERFLMGISLTREHRCALDRSRQVG